MKGTKCQALGFSATHSCFSFLLLLQKWQERFCVCGGWYIKTLWCQMLVLPGYSSVLFGFHFIHSGSDIHQFMQNTFYIFQMKHNAWDQNSSTVTHGSVKIIHMIHFLMFSWLHVIIDNNTKTISWSLDRINSIDLAKLHYQCIYCFRLGVKKMCLVFYCFSHKNVVISCFFLLAWQPSIHIYSYIWSIDMLRLRTVE